MQFDLIFFWKTLECKQKFASRRLKGSSNKNQLVLFARLFSLIQLLFSTITFLLFEIILHIKEYTIFLSKAWSSSIEYGRSKHWHFRWVRRLCIYPSINWHVNGYILLHYFIRLCSGKEDDDVIIVPVPEKIIEVITLDSHQPLNLSESAVQLFDELNIKYIWKISCGLSWAKFL